MPIGHIFFYHEAHEAHEECLCPEVLFFVFFMCFEVNKINCRQNETRLKLKARVLTFYSNHKEEQKTVFLTPQIKSKSKKKASRKDNNFIKFRIAATGQVDLNFMIFNV